MKIRSVHQSVLVLLFTCLLCFFTAEASLSKRRAHSRRGAVHGVKGKVDNSHGALVGKDEDQGDDNADDDDDDDEDEAQAAPVANPHAAEEGKLTAAVTKVEQELAANLASQTQLKNRIKHLSDEHAADAEIDASAKKVANETDSAAMAGMLGKMWKEMRMFDLPFFAQHVEEELHHLKHDEKKLEEQLTSRQAKLSAARGKWAKEAKAKKTSKDAEALDTDEEASLAEKKKQKKEDEAKTKEAEEGDADEDEEAKTAKKEAPEEEPMPTGVKDFKKGAEKTAEPAVLHRWSVWHMNPKQRRAVFMSTLVYLVLGVALAFLYKQARSRYPGSFDPKRLPGTGRAAYGGLQKDFSNSLFGCLADPNICVIGCCCPCIRWADTIDQKGLLSYWKAFFIMFVLMLLHPYTMAISTVFLWIVGVTYRQRLRVKYGIESGKTTVVMDIFAWICCQCCAIVQEAREEAMLKLPMEP